jgi:hypothetical protein
MPEDLMGELSELIGDVRRNVDERLRYLVDDDGEHLNASGVEFQREQIERLFEDLILRVGECVRRASDGE